MSMDDLPYVTKDDSGTYRRRVSSQVDAGCLEILPAKALTTPSEPYQYTPLQRKQIRVLRLLLECDTGRLVCRFEVRELDNSRGSYKAVSYCWGDPTPQYRILCSDRGYLPLSNSAAEVLKYVVAYGPRDFFWVDQLCINQVDLAEKASQVSMMGEVYASSFQVVAWLGVGDEQSEKALKFAEDLFEMIAELHNSGKDVSMEEIESLAPIRDPYWVAFIELLWNSWFNRLWVMQEVVMAPVGIDHGWGEDGIILAIKNREIAFDRLATVISKLEDDGSLAHFLVDPGLVLNDMERIARTPYGVLATEHFRHFRSQRAKSDTVELQRALYRSRGFQTSDPRDKIYAVLGLTSDVGQPALYPNYETCTEDVYFSFTAFLFNREEYPFLLHQAGIGFPRSIAELPSWVPDFSCSRHEKALIYKYPESTKNFKASGHHSTNTISVDTSARTLSFEGIKIDSVEVYHNYSYACAANTRQQLHSGPGSTAELSDELRKFLQVSQKKINSQKNAAQTSTQNPPGAEVQQDLADCDLFDALYEYNLRHVRSLCLFFDRASADYFSDIPEAETFAGAVSDSFRGEKQIFNRR